MTATKTERTVSTGQRDIEHAGGGLVRNDLNYSVRWAMTLRVDAPAA